MKKIYHFIIVLGLIGLIFTSCGDKDDDIISFEINTEELSFGAKGTESKTIAIMAKNVKWTVTLGGSSKSWITVVEEDASLVITAKNNTGTTRIGKITITPDRKEFEPKTITITQKRGAFDYSEYLGQYNVTGKKKIFNEKTEQWEDKNVTWKCIMYPEHERASEMYFNNWGGNGGWCDFKYSNGKLEMLPYLYTDYIDGFECALISVTLDESGSTAYPGQIVEMNLETNKIEFPKTINTQGKEEILYYVIYVWNRKTGQGAGYIDGYFYNLVFERTGDLPPSFRSSLKSTEKLTTKSILSNNQIDPKKKFK